jgi:hypothetical protein
MADVFKNFTGILDTTANNTVFTVPTANVAASPPIPATTYVAKTFFIVHEAVTNPKTLIQAYHYDASEGQTIGFAAEIEAGAAINLFQNGIYVFEAGDQLIVNSNIANNINYSVSLLEIKGQQ